MYTVMTPDALVRSGFRPVRLGDLAVLDWDELCYFEYPSPSPTDQVNGDGRLHEIYDYGYQLDVINLERGDVPATPDTTVYIR